MSGKVSLMIRRSYAAGREKSVCVCVFLVLFCYSQTTGLSFVLLFLLGVSPEFVQREDFMGVCATRFLSQNQEGFQTKLTESARRYSYFTTDSQSKRGAVVMRLFVRMQQNRACACC